MIQRFSSRRARLSESFLNERLNKAAGYDRIAGYFRSSIFEVAGENFESVTGPIRIVCNSELDPEDIRTAQAARVATRLEWNKSEPQAMRRFDRRRYERLADMLRDERVSIRVLPDKHFGLIHGKAGVITCAGGVKTSFLGSINETREAYCHHYELVWEDASPESVNWVQEEFDALWKHAGAQNLADAIAADVEYILKRKVVSLLEWNPETDAPAPFKEAPVEREGAGLLPHQKYFVSTVLRDVRTFGAARYLLADEVGLGKTIQMGMAAALIALQDRLPVLVLCPKNLAPQWQDELQKMLNVPSALWTGKHWLTEAGVAHPTPLTQCPRKIGIVSNSLITAEVAGIDDLLKLQYSCIVLDEAHRARSGKSDNGFSRANSGSPNNLMKFMRRLAPRTRTLLLGTATPIQLNRGELYDLMELLSKGHERVLGTPNSCWRDPDPALDVVSGAIQTPESVEDCWRWLANPLPPSWEKDPWHVVQDLWDELLDRTSLRSDSWQAPLNAVDRFSPHLRANLRDEFTTLMKLHNPFIRHVVKRTRTMLTEPRDGRDPYFKKIDVVLERDGDEDALEMPPKMLEAYEAAREFCRLLAKRKPGAGILKTLLLRRIGSSLYAGLTTAEKLRGSDDAVFDEEDEDKKAGTTLDLTEAERDLLLTSIDAMRASGDNDPKLQVAVSYLRDRHWAERGCIVFSQYFDTVWWFARHISKLFAEQEIGVYAGGTKCYLLRAGLEEATNRESLKKMVQDRKLKLLVATDAASEGLNLQSLQTLINLDLPWNPARLEQRKGRIDRIGQMADTIYLLNLRYRDSVEDDVHRRLSERLRHVREIFGTIPDHLEDVWVETALGEIQAAKQKIDAVPPKHAFEIRYNDCLDESGWDKCTTVLNKLDFVRALQNGWS